MAESDYGYDCRRGELLLNEAPGNEGSLTECRAA